MVGIDLFHFHDKWFFFTLLYGDGAWLAGRGNREGRQFQVEFFFAWVGGEGEEVDVDAVIFWIRLKFDGPPCCARLGGCFDRDGDAIAACEGHGNRAIRGQFDGEVLADRDFFGAIIERVLAVGIEEVGATLGGDGWAAACIEAREGDGLGEALTLHANGGL